MHRNDYPSRRQREIEAEGKHNREDDDYDPTPLHGPMKSVNGWLLFVSNLSVDGLREKDLAALFADFGSVQALRIYSIRSSSRNGFDNSSASRLGYALVEFRKRTEAQDAINRLHGWPFRGRALDVTWAFVKPPV
jgi:RNA recognition motif-containing protein